MDNLTPREVKTLNFLTELCERTKGEWTELSINKLKKKCGVSSIITTLTISNNIVLLYRRGNVYKYKWNSIKPNIKMVRRLLELARESESQYRRDQKHREKTKDEMMTSVEKRYLSFLNDVYQQTKGGWKEMSIKRTANKHRINNYACQGLHSMEIILRHNKGRYYCYKWNSGSPNIDMARKLLEITKTKANNMRKMKTQKEKENNEAPTLLSVDTAPYRAFNHLAISQKDAKKLIDEHGKEMVDSILDKIENNPKNTNYKSLYLTAKTWIKNELKWQNEEAEKQRRQEEQQKKQAEENRKRLEAMNVAKPLRETKKVSILWGLYSYEKSL